MEFSSSPHFSPCLFYVIKIIFLPYTIWTWNLHKCLIKTFSPIMYKCTNENSCSRTTRWCMKNVKKRVRASTNNSTIFIAAFLEIFSRSHLRSSVSSTLKLKNIKQQQKKDWNKYSRTPNEKMQTQIGKIL